MLYFAKRTKIGTCLTWAQATRGSNLFRITVTPVLSIVLIALVAGCEDTTGVKQPDPEPMLAGAYTATAGATTLSLDVAADGFQSVAVTTVSGSSTTTGSRSLRLATARGQDTRPLWVAIEGTRDGDAATITKVEEDREALTDSALDAYLECNPLAVEELAAALLECIGATGSEPPVIVEQSPAELLVGTWSVFDLGGDPVLGGFGNAFDGWEWEFTAHTLNTDTWDANGVRGSRLRWSIELSNTTVSGLRLEYDEICNEIRQLTGNDLKECLDHGTANGSGGMLPGYYVIDRSGTVDTMTYQWNWGGISAYLVFRRVTE